MPIPEFGFKQPKRPKPLETGLGTYAPQLLGQSQVQTPTQQTPGEQLLEKLGTRKQQGIQAYKARQGETTARVASDVASKSAFGIPTDEFGLVQQTLTDFRPEFTKQIQSTRQRGQTALQAEEAKTSFQLAKTLQDLDQYSFSGGVSIQGSGTDIPGASSNNPGAKAVSMAMQAFNNKTPYVWGGNSLTKGVDCSGLVQQIYGKLGINVPRTTYEQAKHGKQIPLNQLRPGDLVFFNTGKADPNGIGTYGHVGIYAGNGQMIDARGSKSGILRGNMIVNGAGPSLAIRPY